MTYGKNWNEIRKTVLERDNFKCRKCGSTEDVDVHHIIPRNISFDDSPENLITLCSSCHKTTDNLYKRYGFTKYMKKWIEENRVRDLIRCAKEMNYE